MRLYLMENNMDISSNQNEKHEFVISIASGNRSYDQIAEWIQNHLIK
jgi:prophage maintenance system killer protein